MDPSQLNWLSATDAVRAIRDGALSSADLVEACLGRVREVDEQVQAWAFLDPEHALKQARAFDERRAAGQPLGPLHGLPVGIKDIIDTADMPTEDGTVLHAGRMPDRDAVRARLTAAGIGTEIYYPTPLHLQPCFADLGYSAGSCPNAEAASAEVLALPIFPELQEEQQRTVADALVAALQQSAVGRTAV